MRWALASLSREPSLWALSSREPALATCRAAIAVRARLAAEAAALLLLAVMLALYAQLTVLAAASSPLEPLL